jgi:hypothetical protein
MRKASITLIAAGLLALLASGCADSGSGLPADKKVIELSFAETRPLCEYLQDVVGGVQREVTCPDGRYATTPLFSVHECQEDFVFDNAAASNVNCGVTVGEYEACTEAIADDPCIQLLPRAPSACAFFDDPSCGRLWLENR